MWGDTEWIWTVQPEKCSQGMDFMEGYKLQSGEKWLQAIYWFFLIIQEVGLQYIKWNYPVADFKQANGVFSHIAVSAWTSLPRSVADGKSLGRFKMQFGNFMEEKFSRGMTSGSVNPKAAVCWLLLGTGFSAGQLLTGAEYTAPLFQHYFRNKVGLLLNVYDCLLFLRQLCSSCWSVENRWNQWQFFSIVKVRKNICKAFLG